MKKLLYILIFCLGFSGFSQNEELFERANAAYAEGDFQEAVERYNQILKSGESSVAIHYNLGNAYYKLNRIAPSIYHYEKALQLDPKDEDVMNNLTFARNMAVDAIEEPSRNGTFNLLRSATEILTLSGWAWLAIFCMMLFVTSFLGYYFSKSVLLQRILFISGMVFLLLCFSATSLGIVKKNSIENRNFAIVFAEEIQVRSEPSQRSSTVLTLHEGAKVEVVEDFQEWLEIELPSGTQGWVERSVVKKL